jgi:hypothetical protein
VIDVAGGTGDIAFRLADSMRRSMVACATVPEIVVTDINEGMLTVGQQRATKLGYGSGERDSLFHFTRHSLAGLLVCSLVWLSVRVTELVGLLMPPQALQSCLGLSAMHRSYRYARTPCIMPRVAHIHNQSCPRSLVSLSLSCRSLLFRLDEPCPACTRVGAADARQQL